MGMTETQAYRRAGYSGQTSNISTVTKDPWVMEQIAKQTQHIVSQARVTREQVEGIVLEAVDIARLKAEPGDMIRGAAELSKMNGFYAPEKKELSVEGSVLIKQLEEKTDTELLELLGQEPDVIEAEFERIDGTDSE